MSTAQITEAKGVDALERRLKKGFTLEKNGRHSQVVGPDGNPVRYTNGHPVTISTTPGGTANQGVIKALSRAGALREKPLKPRTPRDVQAKKREETELRKRQAATRSRTRATEAKQMTQRFSSLLDTVGGLKAEGMQSDLAHMAAQIAREDGQQDMTPDLFISSIHRITKSEWVTPRYTGVWETLADRLEAAKAQGQLQTEFFRMLRDARGLPQETMIEHQQLGLIVAGEWPFRVELLPLDRCLVDHSYQRPAVWMFIRKIARTFDATLVGTIDVSERHKGASYAILDGQLRFEAMRLVGKTQVWASIYEGLDHQAEARFFLHKNRDRKAVHPYYTFRANLIAGDARWIAIDETVRKYGYEIAITSAMRAAENHISAIKACEEAFERKLGGNIGALNCLDPTLKLLRETTLGRRHGQDAHLIRGLSRLFEAYGDHLDWDRLRVVVADRGPDWIVGTAREESRQASGAVGLWVARVVVAEYNRGFTPKLRRL